MWQMQFWEGRGIDGKTEDGLLALWHLSGPHGFLYTLQKDGPKGFTLKCKTTLTPSS